ncbi:MAG: nickel transporter [Devosiaceae bacterium]|nr:nickel transporter [Devosiaceae bacterium MH13]
MAWRLVALGGACLAAPSVGLAQSNPFGVGVPAEPVVGFGFDWLVAVTAQAQGQFYQGLVAALRSVETSAGGLWALLGLSFLYGVVHAAGPGHGKVVIGSYMLASGETARRGAMLAVMAAALQATVAVVAVGLLAGVFGLSQQVLTSATITLERFAYALIVLMGLYLLARFVRRRLKRPEPEPVAASLSAAVNHGHSHDHHTDHHQTHDHHDHGSDCGCDHAHMPDAEAVSGAQGWPQTLALVVGAGMRPCTGALLVLVLALSQGLFWQGSAAAYAMGAGTALTVGTLAVLAGSLSGLLAAQSQTGAWMRFGRIGLELTGALLVLGFGVLLLAASFAR